MYLYNNPNSYRDVAKYQDSKFINSNVNPEINIENNNKIELSLNIVNASFVREIALF